MPAGTTSGARSPRRAYTKLTGVGLLFLASSAFLSLVFGDADVAGKTFYAGGSAGSWLGSALSEYLNRTGSLIVLMTLIILAVILSTQFSFGKMFASASVNSKDLLDPQRGMAARMVRRSPARTRAPRGHHEADPEGGSGKDDGADGEDAALAAASRASTDRGLNLRLTSSGPTTGACRRAEAARVSAAAACPSPSSRAPAQRRHGAFTLPPVTLLDAPKAERKIDERELMESARLLEEKCREFAVEGQVAQIHPGPVVTTFEFKPEAGVKYSKVTSLADDLCLAMQAESVLIDRIPGKSTVGIQIPNPNREAISLRELLESEAYQRSQSKLTLALGKTIHGEPYLADLATMPHLLIAGSTGTGKSVGLNSMLTSLLYRATPDEVRFIMIDPKRLELGMYEEIPHLLSPVVVDPKKAANALRWAVREMEERYKTLAAEGVRNIEQYNRNIRHVIAERGAADEEAPKLLPFVVVVIDELADLMMVASNEVEESICRLAQMARAVGIHLILATQRPSVDVITGLIKANLPSRISFRVSSKTDSRTILDGNGAEQLLGKGDMLFLPPASSRAIRLHGPYISEQESARLASFLRKQGKPVFDDTITAEDEAKTGPGGLDFEKDELYDEASQDRGDQRAGVDIISAAKTTYRLQPCRAARGHDGSRWLGIAWRRRKAARGARRSRVLRGSRCAASLAFSSSSRLARSSAPVVRAETPSPRTIYTDALLRERALRQEIESSRSETPTRRCSSACDRSSRPTSACPASSRAAAYMDNALWQGALLAADAFWTFGEPEDKATALELFSELSSRFPRSSLVKELAVAREAAAGGEVRSLARPDARLRPLRGDGLPRSARSSDERPHRREARGAAGRAAHHARTRTGGHVPLRSPRRSAAGLHRFREYPSGRSHQGRHDSVRRRCGAEGPHRPSDRIADASRDGSGRRRTIQHLHAVQPVSRRHRLCTRCRWRLPP